METGVLPRAEKLPGRAFNYSPPFRAVVKNERSYNSTPPISLHGADRRNFTFLTFFYKKYYIMLLAFFLSRSHEILGYYAQSLYNFNL
jgi:hypothetical protein